jgi:hypothetical protein
MLQQYTVSRGLTVSYKFGRWISREPFLVVWSMIPSVLICLTSHIPVIYWMYSTDNQLSPAFYLSDEWSISRRTVVSANWSCIPFLWLPCSWRRTAGSLVFHDPGSDEPIVYNPGDIAWVLASTALVWIMVPGVGFFYSGLLRSTWISNNYEILLKNCLIGERMLFQWYTWVWWH